MPLDNLKLITTENLHQTIVDYINDNEIIISNFEDMTELILTMIKSRYCFNVERERLRDAMEDITYMCCPDDDVNKDRITQGLEYEGEGDDNESIDGSIDDADDDDLHSLEDITHQSNP
jgi:hypothetical protein